MMEPKSHKIEEFEKVTNMIKDQELNERYLILDGRYAKIKQEISYETPAEIKDLSDNVMQNMIRLAGAIKLYNNQAGNTPVKPENLNEIMDDIEKDLNEIDNINRGRTM